MTFARTAIWCFGRWTKTSRKRARPSPKCWATRWRFPMTTKAASRVRAILRIASLRARAARLEIHVDNPELKAALRRDAERAMNGAIDTAVKLERIHIHDPAAPTGCRPRLR